MPDLIVDDCGHIQILSELNMTYEPYPKRTIYMESENRSLNIDYESRTLTVPISRVENE